MTTRKIQVRVWLGGAAAWGSNVCALPHYRLCMLLCSTGHIELLEVRSRLLGVQTRLPAVAQSQRTRTVALSLAALLARCVRRQDNTVTAMPRINALISRSVLTIRLNICWQSGASRSVGAVSDRQRLAEAVQRSTRAVPLTRSGMRLQCATESHSVRCSNMQDIKRMCCEGYKHSLAGVAMQATTWYAESE